MHKALKLRASLKLIIISPYDIGLFDLINPWGYFQAACTLPFVIPFHWYVNCNCHINLLSCIVLGHTTTTITATNNNNNKQQQRNRRVLIPHILRVLTLNMIPATCEVLHSHCLWFPLHFFIAFSVGLFSSSLIWCIHEKVHSCQKQGFATEIMVNIYIYIFFTSTIIIIHIVWIS